MGKEVQTFSGSRGDQFKLCWKLIQWDALSKKIAFLRRKMLIYQKTWNYWGERSTLEICNIVLQYSFVFVYNPNYKPVFNQLTTKVRIWIIQQLDPDLSWGHASLWDFPQHLSWHREALNILGLCGGVCSKIRLISFKTMDCFSLSRQEFL